MTKEKKLKIVYISLLSVFTIYLPFLLVWMISKAESIEWFKNLHLFFYITFGIAAAGHIFLSLFGIYYLRKSNPQYAEFKKLKSEENQDKKFHLSIKTKLTGTVILTITIILFSFTFVILKSYKKTIIESVSDIGRSQAEQTASVYDSAEGKNDKISVFFDEQRISNSYSSTPYERIDIIISSTPGKIFLEEITTETELPDYSVFAYTTGRPSIIPAEDKKISSIQAHEYIKRYQNGTYRKAPVYDFEKRTCKFIHPVTFTQKAGHKLVGFSIVTYSQDLLMKPYFRIKVFVYTMSAIFFYLSIILTLFLADYLANPLLFLRANVRKTSNSISDILSGNAKIEGSDLVYDDTIKTRDEIKDLSVEIGNLVSLIRGIIPYVSFSTLKFAEKDTKRSTARDLCFLFTDIRGFTSLCEGLPPKDVVGILNHYLEIETEIILANGGDVDKFVGDEMMAFFAGPKKEYNACKAAMEIRAAMRAEQQKSKAAGETFVSIGIGINSGKVVFGPVGSKTRMDFTSIGDTVNLAARLEGANKAYGSKAIISEAVYSKLNSTFVCRELDYITVKGKTEPVRIYEILQKKTDSEQKIFEIKELFERGLAAYRVKKWDAAEKYFNACALKYHDYPSIVFLDRIKHFKENPPPAKWDGVFVMKVK